MDIRPTFTGWNYSWGASISGFIVEAVDDGEQSRRQIQVRPPGSWNIRQEEPGDTGTTFTDLDQRTDDLLRRVDGEGWSEMIDLRIDRLARLDQSLQAPVA